jgi:hypothetical protein
MFNLPVCSLKGCYICRPFKLYVYTTHVYMQMGALGGIVG